MKTMSHEQQIEELLTRGVAEVIDREHLKVRLLSGESLRIKFGIDPTSPNIHLGRSVPLLKLRDFQDLGCRVMFIIGDFTGQIGDTSDKESERPMLSETLVKKNLETYLNQAYKILDTDESKLDISYNSEWLSELSLRRIGNLATWFSLHDFIARENIKKRLDEGKRISLREVLYPLMQGYDSVMVDADIEVGGTDQRFNMLAGREAQRHSMDFLSPEHRKMAEEKIGVPLRHRSDINIVTGKPDVEPQDVLMTDLILGTDGRKMSSSWGNTINLLDAPNEMFGKLMSIPDELIISYLVHCTRVPMPEVADIEGQIKNGANPRDAKLFLAEEIVKLYHGNEAASAAKEYFIETFSKKKTPDEVREAEAEVGMKLVDFMFSAGVAESKGDARRKIEQGGVELGGEKIADGQLALQSEHSAQVLKVGKKDFVRIVF